MGEDSGALFKKISETLGLWYKVEPADTTNIRNIVKTLKKETGFMPRAGYSHDYAMALASTEKEMKSFVDKMLGKKPHKERANVCLLLFPRNAGWKSASIDIIGFNGMDAHVKKIQKKIRDMQIAPNPLDVVAWEIPKNTKIEKYLPKEPAAKA